MSWATHYISVLLEGKAVSFRPKGSSMKGLIESGQLVTIEPVDIAALQIGDIVLCKVRGKQYLHKITGIRRGEAGIPVEALIGNNKGFTNGWTSIRNIYGKCVSVQD